jgi:hypothetical protein
MRLFSSLKNIAPAIGSQNGDRKSGSAKSNLKTPNARVFLRNISLQEDIMRIILFRFDQLKFLFHRESKYYKQQIFVSDNACAQAKLER